MLDIRTSYLLKIINEKCQKGSYKIISVCELISLMPQRFNVDGELISQSIDKLKSGEYILVKFNNHQELCLCPTPKGRLYFEKERENCLNKPKNQNLALTYLFSGISTFIAVFLALVLAKILGVIC